MDIIARTTQFLNDAAQWFDQNILAGLGGFLRALLMFIITILRFFIDVIQWVTSLIP
ncbi:hypothetical protein HY504_01685 [Candidatus Wolfebacteria bacterium]|nr:hypothetical protein [Candidatus Wolfebacteria bacterium]